MSSVAEPSSGVKINGSHTRLLYWCHGVDGRFVSPRQLSKEEQLNKKRGFKIETVFAALN